MAAAALAPERWKQLRPLLDRALDLDDAAREAFLRELSAESEELRRDLERLIARHLDSAGLSRPAAAMAPVEVTLPDASPGGRADPWIGRRIGPYQLTRMLGAGGMGAVYEGQRVDGGFRQTVALKLVGGVHPGLTARFARERQILAELRHPHIAQLLDGGETPEGMPYFALEFIDGRPITEYADATGADSEARLRLLIEVAEALAYAHRRNVIHRDIKPNNILVSADGHVKLLDFGIAKLLKGESGPTLTQQRMGPMTPEYAAPEQFRGGELSIATDIYQFGVLLFRVLGGRLPYRANADDGLAWARAVSEQEPQTLSAVMREVHKDKRAGGASGEITLKRFAPRRARELDGIVRRCLAKSPAARYPSM
ncbi:MAG: serine/threonine protein kinase, partial [Rhodanobacteraceae bacterium]|nr:serine/threonine protein kinase [Rhodanobacteraceae bacterium]